MSAPTWISSALGKKPRAQHGLRFGIGFHDTPARTWGQFMPVRYTSDKHGPMKGVPYDALQTILDGKGKWWEGMDPVDLYGPPHTMSRGPRRPGTIRCFRPSPTNSCGAWMTPSPSIIPT